ncbi:hypothetical protein Pmani_033822 [Petrolisthes manimaculis]|uniref:Uroporphyrinogen-III synthase n=1 Tax=Petrolisthes manimaculis TaxID=1843537 RepID=A0AAE1NQT1_9EUCA|nr:hypothetical protein Pmani_033822 [Petrolisthes manimaculis]
MSIVWLLKSSEDSDSRYVDTLQRSGMTAVTVPVLTFTFCNKDTLKAALEKPQDHSGIIFTSQRAVEAVSQIYSNMPAAHHHAWSEKKVFVIGDATQRAVQAHLKLSCIGQESGNAKQLAPIIIRETKAFDKPLLYPCGNLGRDELPRLLAQEDRDFRALTTYQTSQHPQLKQCIQNLKSSGKLPKVMVFFSPSGVNFTLPVLESVGVNITGVKFVAIGPTTNTALVEHNIPVSGVCPTPTPEGVIHVLTSLL